MENMNVTETEVIKEVIKNEMKEKDDRMIICSDGSVISYQMARNPRFTERV